MFRAKGIIPFGNFATSAGNSSKIEISVTSLLSKDMVCSGPVPTKAASQAVTPFACPTCEECCFLVIFNVILESGGGEELDMMPSNLSPVLVLIVIIEPKAAPRRKVRRS
jgi:hypothetical protein